MPRARANGHRRPSDLPRGLPGRMARGMIPRSPLDDPATAAHAWARYRRLMRFMTAVTVVMVAGSFVALYRENGLVSAHLYVAAAIGIGFSMLLMSALMGLVFLSNSTGHDASIADPLADEEDE